MGGEGQSSKPAFDAAENLDGLINDMYEAMKAINIKGNNSGNLPFYDSIDEIAHWLEYNSGKELMNAFLYLSAIVKNKINSINFKKNAAKENFLSCVEEIESAFNPSGFNAPTHIVFSQFFSESNRSTLLVISERLEAEQLNEKSFQDIESALKDVRAAIDDCSELFSQRASILFKHQLSHLESIIRNYEIFGEDDFWDSHRIVFASFVEIHESISDGDGKNKVKKHTLKMLKNLVTYSSLSANAITIGVAGSQLLLGS